MQEYSLSKISPLDNEMEILYLYKVDLAKCSMHIFIVGYPKAVVSKLWLFGSLSVALSQNTMCGCAHTVRMKLHGPCAEAGFRLSKEISIVVLLIFGSVD